MVTYLLDTYVLAWASTTPERLGPAAVEHLPDVHRDPFDRLLVAQAVAEGAVLLTADDRLTGYGDAVRLVG